MTDSVKVSWRKTGFRFPFVARFRWNKYAEPTRNEALSFPIGKVLFPNSPLLPALPSIPAVQRRALSTDHGPRAVECTQVLLFHLSFWVNFVVTGLLTKGRTYSA